MCYRRILRKGRRVPESGPISDGAACAKVSACVRACVRACGRAWRGINNAAMAQGRPVLFFPFPSHVLVFGIFCFVVVCALCSTLAGWRTTTTTQRKVSQRCWTPPPPPPPPLSGGWCRPGCRPGLGMRCVSGSVWPVAPLGPPSLSTRQGLSVNLPSFGAESDRDGSI